MKEHSNATGQTTLFPSLSQPRFGTIPGTCQSRVPTAAIVPGKGITCASVTIISFNGLAPSLPAAARGRVCFAPLSLHQPPSKLPIPNPKTIYLSTARKRGGKESDGPESIRSLRQNSYNLQKEPPFYNPQRPRTQLHEVGLVQQEADC